MPAASKSSRINVRTTDRQEDLLRRAAAATDSSLTEFVLGSAVARAEKILADRLWFMVDEDQWAKFQTLVDAPLTDTARFEELRNRRSPFAEDLPE